MKKEIEKATELTLTHFDARIKAERKINKIKEIILNARFNNTPGIFIINEIEKVLDDKTANHNI